MLAIAAALLLTPQDLQKPVTILIKPTSAKAALVQLSEKTGVPLSVQPRLASEVVEIEVSKLPLKTLVDKLAYVLHAEVEPVANGLRITRSNQLQHELEETETKAREARLQKLLDKKKIELAKYPSATARAEAMIAALKKQADYVKDQRDNGRIPGLNLDVVRQESPAGRLTIELMILIGAHEAATIPAFRPAVFSNFPVKGQRPLPQGAAALIDQYAETEQQLANFIENGKPIAETDDFYKDVFQAAQMPGGIGKVKFRLNQMGSYVSFSATTFTKDGKMRTYGVASNDLMGDENYFQVAAKLKAGPPVLIPLSPLAVEMQRLVPSDPNVARGDEAPLAVARMSDDLKAFISKPEEIDPLEILGGASVRGYASSKNLDLVACLTERLPLNQRQALSGDKLDLSRFWAGIRSLAAQEVQTEEGLLTVRPAAPISSEQYRLSRPAMGRYVRALLTKGTETTLALARIHGEAGWPYVTSTILRTVRAVLQRHGINRPPDADSHTHQFYCFLASADPAWLERGSGPVRISTLNAEQRSRLYDWMTSTNEIEGEGAASLSDLMKDPSEAFAGDLPDGFVTLALEDQPAVIRAKPQFEGWPEKYRDASKIAGDLAHWAKSGYKATAADLDREQYIYGSLHRLRLRLEPAQGMYIEELTETGTPLETSRPVPYSKLPEAFRNEVQRLYDEAMKKAG